MQYLSFLPLMKKQQFFLLARNDLFSPVSELIFFSFSAIFILVSVSNFWVASLFCFSAEKSVFSLASSFSAESFSDKSFSEVCFSALRFLLPFELETVVMIIPISSRAITIAPTNVTVFCVLFYIFL